MAKKYGPKNYVGKVLKGKPKTDSNGKEMKDSKGKVILKPDQIVVDMDFELKKGMFLKLVSPDEEIQGYQQAVEAGRMSEEKASDLIEKCNKKKAHTRFTIIYQEVSEG